MRTSTKLVELALAALLLSRLIGCGDSSKASDGAPGGSSSQAGSSNVSGGSNSAAGNSAAGGTAAGTAGTQATSGSGGTPAAEGGTAPGAAGGPIETGAGGAAPGADEVAGWIDDYKAAHPGNGGKDWDINAKTPEELAADPDAQRLLDLCGENQRPIIPLLAWEYGGADHQWINPEASALVYCVYIPVGSNTEHWQYDDQADHVEADVYVLFPEQNPCKGEAGADQVMACLGDDSNIEILVDTASLNDGADAGLSLSEASTDLYLLSTDAGRVHLYTGL